MPNIPKFQNSKITICDDRITYKKLFSAPVTVHFDDMKNMIASCFFDGGKYIFNLQVCTEKWHVINLGSFTLEERFEILNYLHLMVTPILLPKLMDRFNEGNDVDFGFLIVNKNEGILKTNNVKRTVRWSQIRAFEYWGGEFARIRFSIEDKEDLFEFHYDNGNIKKETFLFNVMEQMIGIGKMKELKIDHNNMMYAGKFLINALNIARNIS
jgi:predicted AlkP superfamily phosphohydrolase/phosphomutase